jgi:hypothetical protein
MGSEPGIIKRFKALKDTEEEIIINIATISLADVRTNSINAQLQKILMENSME